MASSRGFYLSMNQRIPSRKKNLFIGLAVLSTGISLWTSSFNHVSGREQFNATESMHLLQHEPLSALFNKHFLLNDKSAARLARVVTVTEVKAPAKTVIDLLSDFPRFPEFMKRVKTVTVTRQEGNLVFTESYLKPQMFVSQTCNHTITQLHSKPNTIEWVLIDGNFPSASGRWEIESSSDANCKVTYTVAVDPGPMIPANVVSIGLRLVQKELVSGMRARAEEIARQSSLSKHPGLEHNHYPQEGPSVATSSRQI